MRPIIADCVFIFLIPSSFYNDAVCGILLPSGIPFDLTPKSLTTGVNLIILSPLSLMSV